MPVIRNAKKKLRVDRKRESANKKIENLIDLSIRKAERNPTPKSIQEAFRVVDKSAKKNIIHKNKAARIKSKLSKLINKKTTTSKAKAPVPQKKKKVRK